MVAVQSVQLRLPGRPTNTTQSLPLITVQCGAGLRARVSLRPLAAPPRPALTRHLPCLQAEQRTVQAERSGMGVAASVAAAQHHRCLGCPASWLHWLNPAHLTDSLWSRTRTVITTAAILTLTVIIIIAVKLTCSLYRCIRPNCLSRERK